MNANLPIEFYKNKPKNRDPKDVLNVMRQNRGSKKAAVAGNQTQYCTTEL